MQPLGVCRWSQGRSLCLAKVKCCNREGCAKQAIIEFVLRRGAPVTMAVATNGSLRAEFVPNVPQRNVAAIRGARMEPLGAGFASCMERRLNVAATRGARMETSGAEFVSHSTHDAKVKRCSHVGCTR